MRANHHILNACKTNGKRCENEHYGDAIKFFHSFDSFTELYRKIKTGQNIELPFVSENLTVLDGSHRVAAYLMCGIKTINVRIVQ